MSTGDQSEYLRKKMAERRSRYEQGGQFMKSGFQMWAENERPARQGGAMKEAAARVSSKAGKDILRQVQQLGQEMYSQYYKGNGRHIQGNECESDSDSESDIEGGVMATEVSEVGRGGISFLPYLGQQGDVVSQGMDYWFGKGYSGNGFKEGVVESKKLANSVGDVAIRGYEAYEKASSGDMFGAIDATKGILQSGMDAKNHAMAAADEFKKMGSGKKKRASKKGSALSSTLAKGALGELGKLAGKVGAPILQPCESGWKDEGLTCSKTVPKKLKGAAIFSGEKWHPVHCPGGECPGRIPNLTNGQWIIMKGDSYKNQTPAFEFSGFEYGWGSQAEAQAEADRLNKSWISGWGKGKKSCEEEYIEHERSPADAARLCKERSEALKMAAASTDRRTPSQRKADAAARPTGTGRSDRAAIVKRVMKEKGLSLPQASKYVKEHGLYKA